MPTPRLLRVTIVDAVILSLAVFAYIAIPGSAGLWILVGGAILSGVLMLLAFLPPRVPTVEIPSVPPLSGVASVANVRDDDAEGARSELAFNVEDVFTITGRGVVVAGDVVAGTVRTGDLVRIVRAGVEVARAQVSGIEMFRRKTTQASAGETAGLLLDGVKRSELKRGDLVTLP